MADLERLRAALDEAEQRARSLLAVAQHTSLTLQEPRLLGREIPGWHSWADVEAMCRRELQLVERDRKLLIAHAEAQASLNEKIKDFDSRRPGELIAATARAKAVAEEVERAAEFWLGPVGSEVSDAR